MKNKLTIKQSAKLIERGIQKEQATEVHVEYDKNIKPIIHPIFTLTDLLIIIPKIIKDNKGIDYTLSLDFVYAKDNSMNTYWAAAYNYWSSESTLTLVFKKDSELIDVLSNLLLWTIDNGCFRVEKLRNKRK